MNKGLIGKVSFISLLFLAVVAALIFVLPVFAGIQPSIVGGPSFLVNITSADANQTDEFFTCGNVVYLRFNISCNGGTVCNESLTATANFTAIGGGWREGVNVSQDPSANGWRLFEFNDTVNCSAVTITNFQMANITVNASTYDGNTTGSWAGPVLVNMSTIPGCPPAGEGVQIPLQVPLLNGTFVNTTGQCITTCTADDHAELNHSNATGSYYNLCGPTFGPASINFTQVAYNANFSAVLLVLDIPGKVKINFTTPVNFSDQSKSQAIMQFAMKNMMSGGRVGINESEWNGQGGKPNLNLSASITIYNFSGRFGIPSNIRPSISRRATYGNNSDSFLPCPTGICSGVTWDGQNLTFTVASFSEYEVGRGLSVVLSNTTGLNFNSTINTSYSNTKNINFSYTPTWNSTIDPQTVTLWGNFTGTWAANVTNSTKLNNATLNYINTTVGNDGVYLWNIIINDTTGGNDTHVVNWTVVVDAANPSLSSPTPANNSYIQGSATEAFSIVVSDSNVKNGTLYYKIAGAGSYTPQALSSCAGINPTCTATVGLSNTGTYPDGTGIRYYFEVYDYAEGVGRDGTDDVPLSTTIDRNVPTYANNGANETTIKVGNPVLIYTQWSDTYSLSKAWLSTNETGAWQNKTANYSSPATLSGTSYWSNFSWQNASVTAGTVVQWKIYANDSAGRESVTATGTFTIDGTAPTYASNDTSVANNTEYTPSRNYGFQIDWTDNVAVSDVVFQWGATNYTYLSSGGVNKSVNTYYYNLTNLAAGTYYYKWYANDTSNNWNGSFSNITYVVNLNQSNPVDIYIVNSTGTYKNQNVTITYGTSITANATRVYSNSGTAALYRDESSVAGANETTTLAAKTTGYAYKANVTGNANYSDNTSSVTYYLFVNNASLAGSIAGSNVTYPTAINIGPAETNTGDADVNYTLWRNSTLVNVSSTLGTAPSNDTTLLGVGVYVYVFNSTGGANYSLNTSIATLIVTVSQASNPTNLYINNYNNLNAAIPYGTASNITGTCGSAPGCNIYINETGKNSENNTNITRAAGLYMVKVNTSDSANYSAYSQSYNLTISPASTTMSIYADTALLTGATTKQRHTTNTLNLTSILSVAGKTVYLYRNDSLLSSGASPYINLTSLNLTVGNYTYVANWSGDNNYTTSSATVYVYINDTVAPTVDYASPTPDDNTNQTSTSVTFNVTHTDQYPSKLILYINETPNTTRDYSGSFTNITLTNLYGVYTYYIWLNDTNGNTNQTATRTVKVDNVAPSLSSPTPASGSYIQGSATETFSIAAGETVSQVKNGTLYYKKVGAGSYTSQALSSCAGVNPTCTATVGLSNTGTYPDGTVIRYYFEVYDYAGNAGYNGTPDGYLQTTIDRNAPTYANNGANETTIKVGNAVLIYTQWSDTYSLSKAWLATNETGSWANKTANYSSPAAMSGISNWSNFTWQNASIGTGTVIQWKIYANDSAGNENVTATGSFTIDGSAPTYTSNVTSVANNTQYAPSRNYGFEINWTDNVAVSDVVFQWGTANYTYLGSGGVNKSGSDIYYYNLTNLAAGTYYYKWYANDTSNNWNGSFSNITYVVDLNQTNPVDIYIINSSGTYANQNVTITYNSSITANATHVYPNSGTAYLYRDGANVTGATETVTLAAKTAGYAYLANVTGNANYTSNTSGITYYLIINNATLQGSISGAGVNYPNAVNIGPAETNTGDADVNYTLWRNSTLVKASSTLGSAPSNDTSSLAAATYVYVLNSTGGANYSLNASIATLTVTVSQALNPTNLYINNGTEYANQNVSITYGTTSNITGTCGNAPNCNIYINDTQPVSNNTFITRAAGLYMVKVNTSDNANYSTYSKSYNLTISVASSPIIIVANQSSSINYETSINVTGYNCPAQISCSLYRNDTGLIGSGATVSDNVSLGVGAYTYTYNTSGNENYSSNSTTFNLLVNTKNASVRVYPQNQSIPYGTSVTQYCLDDSSLYNCSMWRGATSVTNSTSITLAAGVYSYVANITDTSNYTNYQDTETLTVSNGTLLGSISGSNVTYPIAVNIGPAKTITGDSDVNYTLWRNSTLVKASSTLGIAPANDTTLLGVGVYVYVLNSTGGANYSLNTSIATLTVTVSINSSTSNYMNLTLGVGTSGSEANLAVTYPNTTNATGWYNSNSFTGSAPAFTLYRNSTTVGADNPMTNNDLFGVGTYVYVYNSSDNTNYSSASKTFTLTVSINSSNPVDLYLNNGTGYKNQNVTITYGTPINATALMTYSGRGSASLYRNNSNVTGTENGTAITLAASTYVYVANTTGNANYSENATGSTYYLTVNRVTSTCSLTFNATSSIIYGTALNATCTCTNPEGNANLYRNNSDVGGTENKTGIILGAATYSYVCNVTQTENYTTASNSSTFTVSQAPTSITLYLNGTAWNSSSSKVYPNTTNVNATINVSALQSSVKLYRNNSEKTNAEEIILLGVDTYNYTGYFAGNTNYTTSQTTQILTISKGTPSLTLSSSPSWLPTDVQATTVTCSATSQNNEVPANLYRNGTDVNSTQNGIAQFYVVGVYNYTCNTTATTNYTTNSTSQIMTVTGTKGSIDGYITDSSGGSGIQGATVFITGYSPVATTASGYYLITGIIPGTYTVTVDKTNYTSNSTSATVTAGVTTQKNMTMTSSVVADTTAPLQPTNLAAVQVGSTRQVNITWTSSTSSDVTGYYVYRASGAVTSSSTNLGEAGNTTRFTDTVPADGTWNYTVVAHDVVPNVNTTITANATVTVTTTDTTAPNNPSSVNATQVGSTRQVNVSWTASTSSDTVKYNVYYKLSGAVTTSDNSIQVGNVTKTSITVASDGNWNFTVTAIDSSNNENTTIVTSANVTIDTTAPSISAVNSPVGAVTTSTVILNVTTTEASSCRYNESDIQFGSMSATMTQGAGNTHNVTLTGLVNEQAYDYYIICSDTAGNIMTSSTHITFTPYTGTVMMVVNGPSGTTTDNTPLLNVSTNQSATCKYSATTNNYGSMTAFNSTGGTTHLHNLSTLTDYYYTYFISCRETSSGKLRESSAFFSVDTRTLYNVTRPDTIFGYWSANQWNSFLLPQLVLQNTTLATTAGTYNVTNVLASVAGNYTIIYYNPNDTSTTWTSYTPGVGGLLTTFNDQTGYRPYWIYINVTNERLEIN